MKYALLILVLAVALPVKAETPNSAVAQQGKAENLDIVEGINLERFLRIDAALRDKRAVDPADQSFWAEGNGYFKGYLENSTLLADYYRLPYAIPKEASLQQIYLIVAKYVNAHPEFLHKKSSELIDWALIEAFPNPDYAAQKSP